MAAIVEELHTGGRTRERAAVPPAPALFLSLFAAQAALVVVAPILPRIAADLGVSTATAGMLRSASGLAAGLTALAMGPLARRFGLRDLLLAGLGGLAAGSVAGAAAPTFPALVAAQVVVGASLAVVIAAGVAAAAAWAPEDGRARVLSWALAGQPSAWIFALPVVGVLAGLGWRWALLVVPVAAAATASAAVATRPRDDAAGPGGGLAVLRNRPGAGRWALGELLAYSAWTGTLVFAGSLFVESESASPAVAGLLLAAGAAAYIPGNLLARRWTGPGARRAIVALALLAAATVAVFGSVRPGLAASAVAFAVLSFLGGARTLVGSAYGLKIAPDARMAVTRVRAATLQFGYLVGTAVGGLALAAAGWAGMGLAMGAMFALAAVPHLAGRRP
jgi:predicted MFS family arabinose efflux permease